MFCDQDDVWKNNKNSYLKPIFPILKPTSIRSFGKFSNAAWIGFTNSGRLAKNEAITKALKLKTISKFKKLAISTKYVKQ